MKIRPYVEAPLFITMTGLWNRPTAFQPHTKKRRREPLNKTFTVIGISSR